MRRRKPAQSGNSGGNILTPFIKGTSLTQATDRFLDHLPM
jgi:hypothetical protein